MLGVLNTEYYKNHILPHHEKYLAKYYIPSALAITWPFYLINRYILNEVINHNMCILIYVVVIQGVVILCLANTWGLKAGPLLYAEHHSVIVYTLFEQFNKGVSCTNTSRVYS